MAQREEVGKKQTTAHGQIPLKETAAVLFGNRLASHAVHQHQDPWLFGLVPGEH